MWQVSPNPMIASSIYHLSLVLIQACSFSIHLPSLLMQTWHSNKARINLCLCSQSWCTTYNFDTSPLNYIALLLVLACLPLPVLESYLWSHSRKEVMKNLLMSLSFHNSRSTHIYHFHSLALLSLPLLLVGSFTSHTWGRAPGWWYASTLGQYTLLSFFLHVLSSSQL